ncbi:MAG TPA: D-aminoacylase [Candidatus Aminicenantes bacterium]|nr:D-aminoacylase [Candidatus Aminicenantes bacterium]HRY66179.1 D-aminoacylase [Candidatus Aminicenantes bacterium]HRZ73093.1 D-aminoacylase [Candidatus Aminicenantes bacterium]
MNKTFRLTVAACVISLSFTACSKQAPARPEAALDLVIQGAYVIDGSGHPRYLGDVGIQGDTIAAVGDLKGRPAIRAIRAEGRIVSPGFIDMHTHCDSGFGRPETKTNVNYLTQGVTTVVTGNCGYGPFSIASTAARWDEAGMGTNACILLGLGTVREEAMGEARRAPSAAEMERMKAAVARAMKEGAFGVSTGLQYVPGRYTETGEIVELAKVAAAAGGLYASHLRSEEENLIPAVEEALRIGDLAGLRVNISHLKSSGRPNWGRLEEAVRLISAARDRGLEATADIYPYDKSATTTLETIFNVPPDLEPLAGLERQLASAGLSPSERPALDERYAVELARVLADPEGRARIRRLTSEGAADKVNWVAKGGWDNFTIMASRTEPQFVGRMFRDLAAELKRPEFDIAADLYVREKRGLLISLSAMAEGDVRTGLRQPWSMISSDGESIPAGTAELVHPRNYGTFPRVLGAYSREAGLFPLEEAVRKMTSLPAQALRLADRGLIRVGAKADLVVFDPAAVRDRATFVEPHQSSEGILFVIVNGKVSVENGVFAGALNGTTLLSSHTKID